MKSPLVTVLIPCLNEKATIKRAILDARKNAQKYFPNDYELLIADNGSTDGTLDIIEKFKNITLVNVPVRGYGAALHWGIMKAKGRYIIFADADLSYPFSNLKLFKTEIDEHPDMVLGSRLKGKIQKNSMPFLHRYFGTPILTVLIKLIYKIDTTDCNSGMRMIKKSFYRKLNMRNSGMEWASELICKTSIKGGSYKEVPIIFVKDKRGRHPHLSSWADGWRHLKAIILLKRESLYIFQLLFILFSIYFYRHNFTLSFLFSDLSIVLLLSLLTLDLLAALIEKKETKISSFLLKFRLVPLTIIAAISTGFLTLLIPDTRSGTKLLMVSMIGILFMWIFLIETIKTHLANRLPDVK